MEYKILQKETGTISKAPKYNGHKNMRFEEPKNIGGNKSNAELNLKGAVLPK